MTGSLINIDFSGLAAFGPAAQTLVDRVCNGINILTMPYTTVRQATADAKAEEIAALSKANVNDIEVRAAKRLIDEQIHKQANLENITALAIENLQADAKPENIEQDWLNIFKSHAEKVSHEDLQSIWAKILANEANNAGSCSTRTLSILSTLSKAEAELFTKLCSFSIYFRGSKHHIICVFDLENNFIDDLEISYSDLQHLEMIGLISLNMNGHVLYGVPNGHFIFDYKNESPIVVQVDDKKDLPTGVVFVTRSGEELIKICEAQPIVGFWDYVQKTWSSRGFSFGLRNNP